MSSPSLLFACHTCGQEFSTGKGLRVHESKRHGNSEEVVPKRRCFMRDTAIGPLVVECGQRDPLPLDPPQSQEDNQQVVLMASGEVGVGALRVDVAEFNDHGNNDEEEDEELLTPDRDNVRVRRPGETKSAHRQRLLEINGWAYSAGEGGRGHRRGPAPPVAESESSSSEEDSVDDVDDSSAGGEAPLEFCEGHESAPSF